MVSAAQRTGQAVGGLITGGFALYHAGPGAKEAYEKFKEGDVVGGLISAGGAALSAVGARAGLRSATALAGRYAPCQGQRVYPWTKSQQTCLAPARRVW